MFSSKVKEFLSKVQLQTCISCDAQRLLIQARCNKQDKHDPCSLPKAPHVCKLHKQCHLVDL